jgi:YidC/Oxa1 family membrane protein insertase
MNKSTVLGLVLIFAILMGYMYLTQPSKEEIAERVQIDSLNRVKAKELAIRDSVERYLRDSIAVLPDSMKPAAVVEQRVEPDVAATNGQGPFAATQSTDSSYYWLESDLLRIKVAAKGGRPVEVELKDYKTYDTLPLVLFREAGSTFSLAFFYGRQRISTGDYLFTPVWYDASMQESDSMVMQSETMRFGMRLYTGGADGDSINRNSYIEFQYSLLKGSYMVGFEVIFSGMKDIIAPQTEQMDLRWTADLLKQEKTTNVMNGSTVYYAHADKSVEYLSESKDDNMNTPTRLKWLSFKQAFFTTVLIADDYFTKAEAAVITKKDMDDPRYLRSMEALIGVPFVQDEVSRVPMSFYFGPNKFTTLRQYDLALERQIPLGWSFFLMQWINRGAVIPVFNWLEKTGMNYGIIILILTLLLKLVLFPVAYKTYISSAKMRVLKPEVDEIAKKFPKKEDAMKKQQATMALYKSVGVNPMAGCVPMLLQFPILLAMFRFFPASIELRQQSFLWAHDLSSYDSILDLGFNIPFYGDHVSLFTLLMTVSTIMYTRMNNQMMAGSNQMPGMKLMMYMMPIMFLGIFNNYSSGLSYYYLLANLITFGQMFIIRKFVDENKLRAKLQSNKQKPVKKSKFQQRLEEAAKQKGYSAKKK